MGGIGAGVRVAAALTGATAQAVKIVQRRALMNAKRRWLSWESVRP